MLTYQCPTCSIKYEANIGNSVSYMLGNRVIELTNSEQDCDACKEKIKRAVQETKEKIKLETTA